MYGSDDVPSLDTLYIVRDPDYDDEFGILLDSWNEWERWEQFLQDTFKDDEDPILFWSDGAGYEDDQAVHLKGLGFSPMFSDEYVMCDNCYSRVIRHVHDCYSWQLKGFIDWEYYGQAICSECLEHGDYDADIIEFYTSRNKLLNEYILKNSLESHGFVRVLDPDPVRHSWQSLPYDEVPLEFESGWHRGQNDNPQEQIELLNRAGIDCIFTGSVSQFYISWYVWVRVADYEDRLEVDPSVRFDVMGAAQQILTSDYKGLPYNKGEEIGKILRGEHSDYFKPVQRIVDGINWTSIVTRGGQDND